jgi:uncharacterized membrane protein (DUF2068 family)
VKQRRPIGLVAIVVYKGFVALMLAITSIALLLALKNRQNLVEFSEPYALESNRFLINWVLDKILNMNPRTLEFSGIATGLYAIVSGVEAIGLWYEKAWAEVLVISIVGLSIPFELFELLQKVSLLKLGILTVNIMVLLYLVRNFSSLQSKK